jgi:hypothetical protein
MTATIIYKIVKEPTNNLSTRHIAFKSQTEYHIEIVSDTRGGTSCLRCYQNAR